MEMALCDLGFALSIPSSAAGRAAPAPHAQLPALSCWQERWCKPQPTAKVWDPRGATPMETPTRAPLHPPRALTAHPHGGKQLCGIQGFSAGVLCSRSMKHQPEPAPTTLSLALNMGNCPFSKQDTAQSHLALPPQPPCASWSMGCLQAQEDASADEQRASWLLFAATFPLLARGTDNFQPLRLNTRNTPLSLSFHRPGSRCHSSWSCVTQFGVGVKRV